MKIFISHGRIDQENDLARQLQGDLSLRGHQVWVDLTNLVSGHDWSPQIGNGLDEVASAGPAGAVIYLMSKHSVRTGSVCHNEIEYARSHHVRLHLVMIEDCQLPLQMNLEHYLDMRGCMPVNEKKGLYDRKMEALVKEVEGADYQPHGVLALLRRQLKPFGPEPKMGELAAQFRGREWLLKRIDEWLTTPDRIFLIKSKPGVGKTALASKLCTSRSDVVAYHFCSHRDSDRSNPNRIIASIAYQLAEAFPAMREDLKECSDFDVLSTSAVTLFRNLIVNPLGMNTVRPDRPQVIVLDALDEATRGESNELATAIAAEFENTPGWLRLIVTTRPDSEVDLRLRVPGSVSIDEFEEDNKKDIAGYLKERLKGRPGESIPARVIKALADRSEGVFLYIDLVCKDLETGDLSLDRFHEFPAGLEQYYGHLLLRQFPTREKYDEVLPGLQLIAASEEPLELTLMEGVCGWDRDDRDNFLEKLGSLFEVVDERIKPFHKSLMDWLVDDTKAARYRVNPAKGCRRLADYGWYQYEQGPEQMSTYMMAHLPTHLALVSRWPDVTKLVTDLHYVEFACQEHLVYDLIKQYNSLLKIESLPAALRAMLQELERFIRVHAHILAKSADQLFQEATQEPEGTVPARLAAERWAEGAESRPWLKWVNKSQEHAASVVTLAGHQGPVRVSLLTLDADRVLSAERGSPIKTWEIATGREIPTPYQHVVLTGPLALSPDDRYLAVADEGVLRIFTTSDGEAMGEFRDHEAAITACAFSPTAPLIATASFDATVRVRNLENGHVTVLEGHDNGVRDCAFSRDGSMIVSGSDDSTLKLWDVASGEQLQTLTGHTSSVLACAFSADGSRVASASTDHTIRVWNIRQAGVRLLHGHDGWVLTCAFHPKKRNLLLSGSMDNTVRLWNAETGAQLSTLGGFAGAVNCCAFSVDGTRFVSASDDMLVRVWDTESATDLAGGEANTSAAVSLAFSPDGREAVYTTPTRHLAVVDTESGRQLAALPEARFVVALGLADGHRRVLTRAHDGYLRVRETVHGRVEATLGPWKDFNCATFGPYGEQVAVGGDDSLRVFEILSGEKWDIQVGHTVGVRAVTYGPEGWSLVAGHQDGTVRLWGIRTGEEQALLTKHKRWVSACAYSSPAGLVASASPDGELHISPVLSQGDKVIYQQGAGITACAFSEDGSRLVFGDWDGGLVVWDVKKRQPVERFTGNGRVLRVSWLPDGRFVTAVRATDRRIRLLLLQQQSSGAQAGRNGQ